MQKDGSLMRRTIILFLASVCPVVLIPTAAAQAEPDDSHIIVQTDELPDPLAHTPPKVSDLIGDMPSPKAHSPAKPQDIKPPVHHRRTIKKIPVRKVNPFHAVHKDSPSVSRKSNTYSGGSPQAIAASLVPSSQLGCFDSVISRESGWNVHAVNPSSGAYGLGQALPGSKMASVGSDWRDNPLTQLRWVLEYMRERYSTPCGALAHENSYGWY